MSEPDEVQLQLWGSQITFIEHFQLAQLETIYILSLKTLKALSHTFGHMQGCGAPPSLIVDFGARNSCGFCLDMAGSGGEHCLHSLISLEASVGPSRLWQLRFDKRTSAQIHLSRNRLLPFWCECPVLACQLLAPWPLKLRSHDSELQLQTARAELTAELVNSLSDFVHCDF